MRMCETDWMHASEKIHTGRTDGEQAYGGCAGRGGPGAASGGREGGSAGADHPAGPRPAHHLPRPHELQHLWPGSCHRACRPPEAAAARHHQAGQRGGQPPCCHAMCCPSTQPHCNKSYAILWDQSKISMAANRYNVLTIMTVSQHALH